MKNSRKRIFYALYIIAAAGCFFYFLFPSDTVTNSIAFHLNKTNPNINITIDRANPSFPPGLILKGVSLYHFGEELFDVEKVKIVPQLTSLLTSKATFNFNGKAYEGILKGTTDLSGNSNGRQIGAVANLAGIQIRDIPALNNLSEHTISGKLSGKFTYTNVPGSGETVNATLSLIDSKVELATPLFSLETLAFINIEAELTLNENNLQIKRCSLVGHQMDGKVTGSIGLMDPPGQSILKLSGTLKPHHVFLAELKKSFLAHLITSISSGESGFPFKITGTLDKPRFSMR
jgi:type II secretion system protein N